MKKILIVLAVVFVLLIVGGFILVSRLDGIVRSQIESNATTSLDLKTTLAGANVGILGGDVTLDTLAVASPEGFTAPSMFSVGGVDLQTSYGKLLGDPVRVDAVAINQPKIVLEQKGTGFNFKVLADRFKTDEPAETDESEPIKVIIDKVTVADAQVELRSEFLSEPLALNIPTFELENIGNADGAETGAEVGRVVMEIVSKTAAQVAQNEDLDLPAEVRALLAGDLNAIAGQLQNVAMDKLNDALPDEVKGLLGGDGLKGLTEGGDIEEKAGDLLGGFLGGKKDDDEK
ncbi:MAG: AsmA family protein [Planctomycetota bacterium]